MARLFLISLALLYLAGCGEPGPNRYALQPGLRATVNVNGILRDLHVSKVEEDLAHLVYYEGDRLDNYRTSLRGLLITEVKTEDFHLTNAVAPDALDPLFPLAIGKQARFTTKIHVEETGFNGDNEVAIVVEDTGTVTVGDEAFNVFIIRIEQTRMVEDQSVMTTQTAYYAPSLGLSLRTIDQQGTRTFYSRIMSLERPRSERRNALGTVVI